MLLRVGGLQYLMAGKRTSYGDKTARYTFEVKTAELHSPSEPLASPSC